MQIMQQQSYYLDTVLSSRAYTAIRMQTTETGINYLACAKSCRLIQRKQ